MSADTGSEIPERLRDRAWKHRGRIALAAVLLVALALAASTYYYYDQSKHRAAQLSQEESSYGTLNDSFNGLTAEHLSLEASHENLTERYNNLSDRFNSLTANQSSLASAYERLNTSMGRLRETGDATIAVSYRINRVTDVNDPKVYVNATAYNLGDREANRVVVKCKIIYEGQPIIDEVTFTNLMPLDKRSYSWNFTASSDVDAVWAE